MANPDRRLGLVSAAGLGLAAIGGGIVFSASASESQRLQAEQRLVGASRITTGIENPRVKPLEEDLSRSLIFSAAVGTITAMSAVGAGVALYVNRKRPEFIDTSSAEPQQKG